eukprot:886420_1
MNLVLQHEEEHAQVRDVYQARRLSINPSMEQLMDEFTDAMRSYFDRATAAAADMIENTMEAQRKQLILKGIVLKKENRKSKRNKVLGIRMDKADHATCGAIGVREE